MRLHHIVFYQHHITMNKELELCLYGIFAGSDINFLTSYTSRTKYYVSKYKNLTVYKSPAKQSGLGAVLLISGGCRLEFDKYMQKFADDMDCEHDLYVCENFNTHNMLCIDELSSFVKQLGSIPLTIIGFSMGGVIGSHILANTGRKATLITFDTPYAIPISAPEIFEDFRFYRIDITQLYWLSVLNCPESNVRDIIEATSFGGYARFIERRYGILCDEFVRLNTMNPNMRNCRVVSFYSRCDLLVHRTSHLPIVEDFKARLNKSSSFVEREFATLQPGHCSVMVKPKNSGIICQQIREFL
jgi:pimeloyl-ACP methyl ester carboxylesterase